MDKKCVCGNPVPKGRRKYCSYNCGVVVYYKEHKKEYLEASKKSRIKHKEKRYAAFREWYKNNKEKHNKYMKEYFKKNQTKNSIRKWDNVKNKQNMLSKYKKCVECGTETQLELHHKDYEKKYDTSNLKLLCRKCHRKLHRK